MSKAWPLIKLGEVLAPTNRQTALDPSQEYRLLGVRLDGCGPFLREQKLGSQISANTLYQVKNGDFIYSRLFAWRGAFGVICDELDSCFVSNEFPTFTAKKEKLNVNFLKYWFRLPHILKRVEADCTGSTPLTRNRYKENFFLNLQIPLPPLAEQQRIVAKIERLEGKIEEAKELREQISENSEAFTVSVHIKFSRTQKKKIGDILTLDEDRVPITKAGEYPQVGIKSFGDGLFPKTSVCGTETTYKNFNRLYEGAILLSQVKGWEGAIAVCDKDLAGWYVSPEYRTFRCIPNKALPEYMAALVKTKWFWKQLKNATRGVGARRERTRPEQFLTIQMPMPDIKFQKLGQQLFNRMEKIKHSQAQITTELNAMLPSILDKAFKGEL